VDKISMIGIDEISISVGFFAFVERFNAFKI